MFASGLDTWFFAAGEAAEKEEVTEGSVGRGSGDGWGLMGDGRMSQPQRQAEAAATTAHANTAAPPHSCSTTVEKTFGDPYSLLGPGGFSSLLKDELLTDLVVNVEGRRVPAHLFVLATVSDFFKALCGSQDRDGQHRAASGWQEQQRTEISLPDLPGGSAAFRAILNFGYRGTLSLSGRNCVEIMCAAQFLLCNSIVDLCERYLENEVLAEATATQLRACAELLARAHAMGKCAESIKMRCMANLGRRLANACCDESILSHLQPEMMCNLADSVMLTLRCSGVGSSGNSADRVSSRGRGAAGVAAAAAAAAATATAAMEAARICCPVEPDESTVSTACATYLSLPVGVSPARRALTPDESRCLLDHLLRDPIAVPARISSRLLQAMRGQAAITGDYSMCARVGAALVGASAPGGSYDQALMALRGKMRQLEARLAVCEFVSWMGLDWKRDPDALVGAHLSVLYPVDHVDTAGATAAAAGTSTSSSFEWYTGICTACQRTRSGDQEITWHYVVYEDGDESWLRLGDVTFRVNKVPEDTAAGAQHAAAVAAAAAAAAAAAGSVGAAGGALGGGGAAVAAPAVTLQPQPQPMSAAAAAALVGAVPDAAAGAAVTPTDTTTVSAARSGIVPNSLQYQYAAPVANSP